MVIAAPNRDTAAAGKQVENSVAVLEYDLCRLAGPGIVDSDRPASVVVGAPLTTDYVNQDKGPPTSSPETCSRKVTLAAFVPQVDKYVVKSVRRSRRLSRTTRRLPTRS